MLAATWGSDSHHRYAAPDREISIVVRACRNFCSDRAGGHGCASAHLLSSQRCTPVPRLRARIGSALHPRYQLLQPRLLPRRDHIPVRASAAANDRTVHAECKRARSPIESRFPRHRAFHIPIHPRSPASVPHLTDHPRLQHCSCGTGSQTRSPGEARPLFAAAA